MIAIVTIPTIKFENVYWMSESYNAYDVSPDNVIMVSNMCGEFSPRPV